MKASHMHLKVKDLNESVQWFRNILKIEPLFQNEFMAVIPFGDNSNILDKAEDDVEVTIAFESKDCDVDFDELIKRGAKFIERPEDKEYGVRVAYIEGPGRITIELEQILEK